MSKLTVEQKTIKELFQAKQADFLIPDYQRPYTWGETECRTLWEDIFAFAIPDEGRTDFDDNNEYYFLGSIVTFKNGEGKSEIIDGQQRLTTLMLLLRAFCAKAENMKDERSVYTKQDIEKCIWKTNTFGKPNKQLLKIDSEVINEKDKDEFLKILKDGEADAEAKSRYAENYRFFEEKINEFINTFPTYFPYLPTRIMNNCIVLPIEAESQDTALRIFSTLNDRGMPLSDADIFKAKFYKFYSSAGKKDEFIDKWKELNRICKDVFHPKSGTPVDEIFTRYMYYRRAKGGNKSSTTEGLRKFYEKKDYEFLREENTLQDLIALAQFWEDVSRQNQDRFALNVLRRLFVLNYAPNGMWTYIVSVYFMQNRDARGMLDAMIGLLPF